MHIVTISKKHRVITASINPEVKTQLLPIIFEAVTSILPMVLDFIAGKEESSA